MPNPARSAVIGDVLHRDGGRNPDVIPADRSSVETADNA
jgi:hypothetical protein